MTAQSSEEVSAAAMMRKKQHQVEQDLWKEQQARAQKVRPRVICQKTVGIFSPPWRPTMMKRIVAFLTSFAAANALYRGSLLM